MIDPRNFGDIKKIRWSRASRTDKKVHALLNYFSCKLHVEEGKTLDDYKNLLNEITSDDMHIFSLQETGRHFDARCQASYREYDYYIPTFLLQNQIELDFTTTGDEQKLMPNGYALPRPREDYHPSDECKKRLYEYRMPEEDKERLQMLFKKFEGTNTFHNYTRDCTYKDATAKRYMIELRTTQFSVHNGIEFCRVYLKGQSFLYN